MGTINMTVGNAGPNGATVAAKVDTGPVRLAVADNSVMSNPTFFGPVAVDSQGRAKVTATALSADTNYWYQIEDNSTLDTSITGEFRTHPLVGQDASFSVIFVADAGLSPDHPGIGTVLASNRLSDSPVFDSVRMHATNPLITVHLGDLHYYDLGSGFHGISGGGSLSNYRRAYDDVFLQTRQHQLYYKRPWVYLWNDHCYGPNNSDGTLATKGNALQAYGECVPHYLLAGTDGIYHSFQIGRILFVVTDERYNRSPNSNPDGPSKTMLGNIQKNWFESLLNSSDAEALIWCSGGEWLGTVSDTWGNFETERTELATMFKDTGWNSRMVYIGADKHALGIASGSANSHGEFPVFQFAPVDATPNSESSPQYDIGYQNGTNGQFGVITVTDRGRTIDILGTGYDPSGEWGSHLLQIHTLPIVGHRGSDSHVLAL